MPRTHPQLMRSAPYFLVPHAGSAAEEYGERFGFMVDYLAAVPAEFAIVSRDGLHVMLRGLNPGAAPAPNATRGGTWDVFFWVASVDALFAEFQERGALVVYPPTDRHEYGMREFAVQDSTGYVLGFGEPFLERRRDSGRVVT